MILSLRILDMSVKTTVLEEGARGPVTMEQVDEQGGALRVYSAVTAHI